MQEVILDEALEQILARDTRFHRDAYHFLREALDYTQRNQPREPRAKIRHVTGQELLEGIRRYGLEQYGPMTLTLLQEWGVRRCEDFGDIVFNMVEARLLAKTDQDSREDFADGYTFEEAFRKPFLPAARLNGKITEPEAN
jgi:uncharacterized repeat protein (TIGR04138 family)